MICKPHAFHTRPHAEQGHDLSHWKILATLLPDAQTLCRSLGLDLSKDAFRLRSVLDDGRFPLPADFAGEALGDRLGDEMNRPVPGIRSY